MKTPCVVLACVQVDCTSLFGSGHDLDLGYFFFKMTFYGKTIVQLTLLVNGNAMLAK